MIQLYDESMREAFNQDELKICGNLDIFISFQYSNLKDYKVEVLCFYIITWRWKINNIYINNHMWDVTLPCYRSQSTNTWPLDLKLLHVVSTWDSLQVS